MVAKKTYKIKHQTIGLYSVGGTYVNDAMYGKKYKYMSWKNKGKTWNGKGPLKLHLRQYCSDSQYLDPVGLIVHWREGTRCKFWTNNIPETWIVEETNLEDNTVITYKARGLYPETEI